VEGGAMFTPHQTSAALKDMVARVIMHNPRHHQLTGDSTTLPLHNLLPHHMAVTSVMLRET